MAILNISYAKIKDADKFRAYVEAAAKLMTAADVEVVARGSFVMTKRGDELNDHITAVFRYPDMASVEAFYGSEAYKKLIPLRDEACEMTIQLYEEL